MIQSPFTVGIGRWLFRQDAHFNLMTSQSDSKQMTNGLLKAVLQGTIAGLLIVIGFVGGYVFRDRTSGSASSTTSFELLQDADGLMQTHFLYDIPPESDRVHGAISGLVASYKDPYTFFVEPQKAEVDADGLAGKFGGIGAELSQDAAGNFVISRLYRDNPALKAGLQEGDILIAVDGKTLSGLDMNAVLALVRGDVGSSVKLTIRRDQIEKDYSIIRAEVLIPSAFWRLLDQDKRIGYIQLTRFTDRAPDEVRQAIDELQSQGAQALILDLRDNGGGLVDSSVQIAGEFLNGGMILNEESRGHTPQVFNAPTGGHALEIPLAVLINKNTASASEIVGGALQDRSRAKLIGERSYGKGSVQLILPLKDGSSIHVTTAQWFTPNHHPLEGKGLTPDIEVEPSTDNDAILSAAIDYIDSILPTASH